MSMQTQIENKLKTAFPNATLIEVINETHMHNVPPDSESHFKVSIVADEFEGKMLVARHRQINTILADELKQIHALAIHTMTPDEYFKKAGKVPESPPCEGGSK